MARKRRGRGEGAIYFRKDRGDWCTQVSLGYDAEGRRIRRTLYGKTKREVQEKLLELQRDALQGLPIKPEKLTVAQHFDDWLRAKRPPALRPTTYAKYRYVVEKHIVPAFGGLQLKALDYRRLNAFYELLDEEGLSPRYVFDIANILKAGLEDAVRKGLIPHNPAKLAARRSKPAEEARFLTQDELCRFLIAARGEWLEDFFILLLHTGLRAGEALGLPWDAVDLKAAKLTVRQAMLEVDGRQFLGEPKTQASRRTISLPKEAVVALRRQHHRQLEAKLKAGPEWENPHNLVFTNHLGGFLQRNLIYRRNLRRILNRAAVLAAAERLGCDPEATLTLNAPYLPARAVQPGDNILLPDGRQAELAREDLMEGVGLHTFRHTHAALLIAAGVDIKTVQRRLGHENVSITLQIYGHLLPGQDERAAQAMDRLFLNTP